MHGPRRTTAAILTAATLLAGSSMLAFPATAHAETKTVPCGSEITAHPGDHILATDPLLGLVPLDLGTVTDDTNVLTGTINALLGTVCRVTVTVVDKVVEPIPGVGEPAAETLKKGVSGMTDAAQDTVTALGSAASPSEQSPQQPPPESPRTPTNPAPPTSGGQQNTKQSDPTPPTGTPAPSIPQPATSVIGNGVPLSPAFLPQSFSSGYAPMRDYSGIPVAQPGVFAPAPGIRYGSQIPGYTPEFDILADNSGSTTGSSAGTSEPRQLITQAGAARALPGAPGSATNPASLPVLFAVIALAASTAALVRTWVLRRV